MSYQKPDTETNASSADPSLRPSLGFSDLCISRLGPLALDNARTMIDPMLYPVTVAGLSRKQIDEVDFRSIFRLERIGAAFSALTSALR